MISTARMVDDYRLQFDVVGWALCSVAIVVVGARSYCRYFLIHSFGLDDALMVLALVCLTSDLML